MYLMTFNFKSHIRRSLKTPSFPFTYNSTLKVYVNYFENKYDTEDNICFYKQSSEKEDTGNDGCIFFTI